MIKIYIKYIKILPIITIIGGLVGCREDNAPSNNYIRYDHKRQNVQNSKNILEGLIKSSENLINSIDQQGEKERAEELEKCNNRLDEEKKRWLAGGPEYSSSVERYTIDEVKEAESVLEIKNIDDFELDSTLSKKDGKEDGGIYKLKTEPTARYLIKFSEKRKVICDFVGAFILRKIIGNRAPINYIVRLRNGNIAVASRFIENFITLADYRKLFYFDKDIRGIIKSKEMVEANLLANFINQTNFHWHNKGFIVKDGKIVDYALIDFDHALLKVSYDHYYQLPSNKYYAGIDEALRSLKLIASFKVGCLDKLEPLFKKIEAELELCNIKELIVGNLFKVKTQITACELAQKIINKNFTEEEFEQLINMGDILLNFNLQNESNILMDSWGNENDITHITKALSKVKELAPSFIRYCLYNNKNDLLRDVISRLCLDFDDVTREYFCGANDLLQIFLNADFKADEFLEKYSIDDGLEEHNDELSIELYKQIIAVCLRDNKITLNDSGVMKKIIYLDVFGVLFNYDYTKVIGLV